MMLELQSFILIGLLKLFGQRRQNNKGWRDISDDSGLCSCKNLFDELNSTKYTAIVHRLLVPWGDKKTKKQNQEKTTSRTVPPSDFYPID